MNPFSASALSLRRRSVWEAADSGILLWRGSFIRFMPVFALPVLITAAALRFMPGNSIVLSYLVIWWLRPLFDRLVLHVVSIRFFAAGGEPPSRLKGLWAMRRGLVGDLLWRRFSPYRAARMPIRVLERMGGEQFRMRKKALDSGGLDFCSFISAFGLTLEAVLLLSKVVFVSLVCRMFFPEALDYMGNNMEIVEVFIFAAFCLNYILVGSLYVCMGFGLYINSRVEVEGWDLQLLFQKFAGNSPVSRTGVKALLLLCLFLALPQTAAYSESEPSLQSLEVLQAILASPDFGEIRESWGIRLRERDWADPPDRNFAPWLERIRHIFGYILRAAAILVMAGFVCFALYWYWKHRWKGIGPRRDKGEHYANALFSPESPQALFARAEDFFHRGKLREAWAACLSGCIGACVKYRSLSFPANATEYGCLDLVRRSLPGEAAGFAHLVRSWILFAYGGRAPGEGSFEEALAYGRSLLNVPAQKGALHRGPDEP